MLQADCMDDQGHKVESRAKLSHFIDFERISPESSD